MKILVLIKQTPDTDARIAVSADGKVEGIQKWIINPYDEHALEAALQIQKDHSAEVVAVTVGPEDSKDRLLRGLAMGADRGILVKQDGVPMEDSLAVAKICAAVIKKEAPDLVLCGKQGIDDDSMHVGPMVAELLGWPHVSVVSKLEVNAGKLKVEREVEGGQIESYSVTTPALIGAHKSLNNPRFVAVQGMMKAKKKPLDVIAATDLVSGLKSTVQVLGFSVPPSKPTGKVFKGESAEIMVQKVVKLLKEEAKVL